MSSLGGINPSSTDDYFTVAFYAAIDPGPWVYGALPYFHLIAIDKTRYYFQLQPPQHFSPTTPTNLTTTSITSSTFVLNWDDSTDFDSPDSNIIYEYKISSTGQELIGEWQPIIKGSQIIISDPGDWTIYLRAKDDSGLYSEPASINVNISKSESMLELKSEKSESMSKLMINTLQSNNLENNLEGVNDEQSSQNSEILEENNATSSVLLEENNTTSTISCDNSEEGL